MTRGPRRRSSRRLRSWKNDSPSILRTTVSTAPCQTYAALERGEDAIRHGRRAVELYPLSKDALQAPVLMTDLALTYTLVGDHDAALEQLDEVLSIPSILSTAWLEKDPRWDPLREHPGYAALLREHPVDW